MKSSIIFKIISGTPLWVYGVFGYLLWIGVAASKTRILYIPRLFLIPILLLSLKVHRLITTPSLAFWMYLGGFLLLGLAVGSLLAYIQRVKINAQDMTLVMPGSWITLVFVLIIFITRYYSGYMLAVYPLEAQCVQLLDISVSGAVSGIALGRACFFLYKAWKLQR